MQLLLSIILLVLFSTASYSLDFSRLGGTFTMEGEIKEGDTAKFLLELSKWENPPTIFHINSPGGNLDEAMTIGGIIRESQIPVWSGEVCSSACVFILVAGVERNVLGKIGLHRPYFEDSYFANLTSTEAKNKYEELKKISIKYLKEMEVSQQIIERIFATGSARVDIIDKKEAEKLLGHRAPFYDEWLSAKCGSFTEEESKIIKSYWSLLAARATYSALQDKSIEKSEGFGSNLKYLVEEGKLAYELEKANLIKPYIDLSEKHNKCTEKSSSEHVFNYHYTLKKMVNEIN